MTRTQLIGAITDLLVAGQKRTALQLRNLLIDIVNNVLCPADNGNVGIGTTAPAYKLEVAGSANSAAAVISAPDGTLSRLGLANPSRYWSISNYGSAFSNAFAISDETAGTTRFLIDASGNVGLGLVDPTEKLDIQGNAIRLRTAKTPASATATGAQGQVCWDSNYVYVCVATNTWKRAALSTW